MAKRQWGKQLKADFNNPFNPFKKSVDSEWQPECLNWHSGKEANMIGIGKLKIENGLSL